MSWSDKPNGFDLYGDLLARGTIRDENKEPEIGPFMIYIEMFFELDTCRGGMGNNPISFTDIYNFATIKGISDFDDFLYLMRRLDHIIINYRDKKNDNSNKNNSSTG